MIKIKKIQTLGFILSVVWLGIIYPQVVNAQTYPNKPIALVNPFAAGGSLDQLARILAQKLSESIGQPVIVENKTGAGGNIGAAYVDQVQLMASILVYTGLVYRLIQLKTLFRFPYQ